VEAQEVTADGLWALEVNEGLVNWLVKDTMAGFFSSPQNMRWISFDRSTFLSTVQIDCSSDKCFGSPVNALNKMYVDRAAVSASLELTTKTFIQNLDDAFKLYKTLGPALVITLKPDTFPATGVATYFFGAMTLQVANATAFVSSPDAKAVMEHSIAASNKDINQNMVAVTNLAVARRLSAKPRGLTAGGVTVEYTVTYPPGASNPVLTAASINTTLLIAAVQTKAAALGMAVSVTSVTVAEPTSPSATTTTTTTMTGTGAGSATTAGTGATTGTDTTNGAIASTGLLALVRAVVMAALAAAAA